ncbi:MAG TPA: hypothetical protein VIY47_13140 [Ignavibacteriaceae bacterium]
MHKKIYIHDLDIPKDDIECWNRYPKHRWVYDQTRLFDAQGIKWLPWISNDLKESGPNLILRSDRKYNSSDIYFNIPNGNHLRTEVYIVKGEIKYLRHLDIDEIDGGVEMRINAFVAIHFNKFTGVLSIETYGNEIFHMSLMSHSDFMAETNTDIIKLLNRIYKRSSATISGPTDQVLQESLAS